MGIDNNASERAIKPFVMGHKGWLFSDSIAGARSSAVLYTLVYAQACQSAVSRDPHDL